ncbi:hypothetical protein B0O41_1734 [Propionibacteriaceae bacterium ES.041]|uniref:hypothetical protein n=1 Tax=Enemella evansiae TaxID=2016499 RepID=UPI000B96B5A2|nr:hypothetical protein [Enemella evansiae]OYO02226.1 hypothetical protein CGZ96_02450 [Enemella evansiae]PFG66931.1 hypothetical protein B0O41_1734 [Propionibacteriaceae bacterium ES.041]
MTGTDWVPVAAEPAHGELFANRWCRVYQVDLTPGQVTLDHLHHQDTVYLIVRGGRFRSDNLYATSSPTRPGASTGLLRTVGWLAGRLLSGWLRMPAGTVLWQPHRDHPVIHRVRVSAANREPIRMLGVELRGTGRAPRLRDQRGVRLECASERSATYRFDSPGRVRVPGHAVLTAIRGEVSMPGADPLRDGRTIWLDGPVELRLDPGTVAVATLLEG